MTEALAATALTTGNPAPPLNSLPVEGMSRHRQAIVDAFEASRRQTLELVKRLSPEDQQVQSMADASPTKWHLAHTSWFYAAVVLDPFDAGFRWPVIHYRELFNSYYNALGQPFKRPRRGLLTRPSLTEVLSWRSAIEERLISFLRACDEERFDEIAPLVVLGINHEQQHQELLVTDVLHALSLNPWNEGAAGFLDPSPESERPPEPVQWVKMDGGLHRIGHCGEGFRFDNECPQHEVRLDPFELASQPVTNDQWLAFISAGGYQEPKHWLSDGWAWRCEHQIEAPLYWKQFDNGLHQFTPAGWLEIERQACVSHISFYEADAFARWAGARLPTEMEWERAAENWEWTSCGGVAGSPPKQGRGGAESIGQVWEWTSSAYSPYPGFCPEPGAVGEYNGKFMVNQMVLRGASLFTQELHGRPSYRNFFYPDARWQHSGLRLARNVNT